MDYSVYLIGTAAAPGSSSLGAVEWIGGGGSLQAVGDFGGGTLSLQFLGPDGLTWVDGGAGATLTENGSIAFALPTGQIQAALSDATDASLQVTATVVPTLIGG